MDTSEYLPMFLAEAREHLQELNLAVVKIEESPDDPESIDAIFRIAHSFKGMSATMGFAGMAELTHAMEDVFELLKQRSGGLSRDAIDVLLASLDALGGAVDAIDQDGEEAIQHGELVERLRALTRAEGEEAPPAAVAPVAVAAPVEDRRVLHVTAQLSDDAAMQAVRAYMLLAALAEHGEIVESSPTEDGVEAFAGKVIEVWLASEHEEDAVAAAAREVPDVATVTVLVHEPKTEEKSAAPAKHAKKGSSTVRVDAERLDQLMHFMGELVVHRTRVEGLAHDADVPGLAQAMQDLTRSSQALQQMVMQVRMIEVEAVFLRFPRLVRDLSSKLGKQVQLTLTGGETELDRTVVDALGDPMVHLVRNSLDHGLETTAERTAAGKPETGTLEIAARHAGGNVVISVRDDGKGIDARNVAQKAAEKGLIPHDAVDTIDTPKAIELLFHPGFSTADSVNDISGRGVGMDAVRNMVRALGGEVLVTSELGKGTDAQIRLPLTLAIMSALLVEANGLPFAIPLDRVERTLLVSDHTVRSVAGRRMLVMRDDVLPIVDGSAALGHGASGDEPTHAVIVRAGDQRLAVAVHHLVGQRELVTRALPPELETIAAVSGGAVLADGNIALIVDCDALIGAAADPISVIAA
ncbi:MAG: two-component system, chemotaxis family, sensor kinase CheA [Thermoleophilales bacterium]|jgi:two-component system chemotaxis sensor kinase CheA|nr:two-component system, chemotaxis family, sensor kinase CheA [Thermoleophilales bacterium]